MQHKKAVWKECITEKEQQEKNATWNKCSMKKVLHEKSPTQKKVKHECYTQREKKVKDKENMKSERNSYIPKECSMKKVENEKGTVQRKHKKWKK